jgi:hypothetical protein
MNKHAARPVLDGRLAGAPRCRECEYPLLDLPESRCPECGRDFDPADSATFILPAKAVPDRTVRQILVMAGWVVVLVAWPMDMGELVFHLTIAGSILFAVARHYAITSDPKWLTPVLFPIAFATVYWFQIRRMFAPPGWWVIEDPASLVIAAVCVVGAIALVLMKAESHALRRRGGE